MLRRLLVLSLLSVWMALPVYADEPNKTNAENGCRVYAMCLGEADTGVCAVGGEDVLLTAKSSSGAMYGLVYSANENGTQATTFSCNLYGGATYSATHRDALLAAPVTESNFVSAPFTGPMPPVMWIECSAIGDNFVSMFLKLCPAK